MVFAPCTIEEKNGFTGALIVSSGSNGSKSCKSIQFILGGNCSSYGHCSVVIIFPLFNHRHINEFVVTGAHGVWKGDWKF